MLKNDHQPNLSEKDWCPRAPICFNPHQLFFRQVSLLVISALILLQLVSLNLSYSKFSAENFFTNFVNFSVNFRNFSGDLRNLPRHFSSFLTNDPARSVDFSVLPKSDEFLPAGRNLKISQSSSSNLDSTSYLSSSLSAQSGSININTKEDTNIKGSSILASDINITTNNLNVESLQSKLTSSSQRDSYSLGGTVGFNNSDSNQDRLWTDNIASIIGTNSVTINTENNTDIKGAMIANCKNNYLI